MAESAAKAPVDVRHKVYEDALALVIGTLLLFAWLVERRERLYLWSALQLLMLALLLSPYLLSEPLLPSPLNWRPWIFHSASRSGLSLARNCTRTAFLLTSP